MVLGFFIAVLIHLAVVDVLVVMISRKSSGLNNMFKLRGYWYHYELENDYIIHCKPYLQ